MAAAGAKAAEAAGTANDGLAEYTIKRLGPGPARRNRRAVAVAAAVALLTVGGWTGDGCDGSTLWTMDPNGKQPVLSTLTWSFSAAGASRCTLAVFVPSANALGTFPVSGPSLEITTAPEPDASGHGHHGAIAASAARAVCTA